MIDKDIQGAKLRQRKGIGALQGRSRTHRVQGTDPRAVRGNKQIFQRVITYNDTQSLRKPREWPQKDDYRLLHKRAACEIFRYPWNQLPCNTTRTATRGKRAPRMSAPPNKTSKHFRRTKRR